MRMLRVGSIDELLAMPRNWWGIPEPTEEATASMADGLSEGNGLLDAVVVPAMAFDTRCMRLGHGKGYYDTFLEKLQAARDTRQLPTARMIGLGLQEQLVSEVPTEEHDVPLDCICLPDGTFYCDGAKPN